MKFSKYLILFILISYGCMHQSHNKANNRNIFRSTRWEVVKIKKEGASTFTDADKSYTISFNDLAYQLHLDANNCAGPYKLTGNETISFGDMRCTEMCCDSKFAMELSRLLPQMTHYQEKGNEMILKGKGIIVLKKIK